MDPLKELDRSLAEFLEPDRHMSHACRSQVYEEFLCCCERGRHAIKDFTNQGDDGKVSDCFPVAGDALRDLQWCLERVLAELGHGDDRDRSVLSRFERDLRYEDDLDQILFHDILRFGRVLVPIVQELRKASIKQQSPSVYCSDARDGHGSAHLSPSLDVDFIGEIVYLSDLGEGSQGKVYKAVWGRRSAHLPPKRNVEDLGGTEDLRELGYEAWSQLVAVKEVSSGTQSEGLEALEALFSRNSGRDSVSRNDLDRELDVLKTLNHPNIVELKGYTRKVRAGKYGLVMELMKNSLKGLIESGKLQKFSDLQKVDLLLQVARGMHFLHTVGIMHRDLKPANILIRELNHLPPNASLGYVVAKLADFGLSKGVSKQEDLEVDGAGWHTNMQGTKFFMAPELRKSSNDRDCVSLYAISADVFSFGTTCFNVLTGEETPFALEGHPLTSEEFYKMIEEGHLFNIKCERSKMALLVRQCWCLDPRERPDFLKICQILEDEKREILCASVPGKVDENEDENGIWFFNKMEVDRIFGDRVLKNRHKMLNEVFHNLGGAGGKVHLAYMRPAVRQLVVVKEVSFCQFMDLPTRYSGFKMLNHPNVVEVKGYTTWESGCKYGVVMDLMRCSLQDLIKKMPNSELASIDVLLQVARGMEFLHARGITHLGLKPANILIDLPDHINATHEEVVAKIADFWQIEATDWDVYKHFYRDPEVQYLFETDSILDLYADAIRFYRDLGVQYRPSVTDKRLHLLQCADVFSFGTICFNVLTGQELECPYPLGSWEFVLDELYQKCGESRITLLVRLCWSPHPEYKPPFSLICRILEMEKKRRKAALFLKGLFCCFG